MKQKILSLIMIIVVAFNAIAIPVSAETLTLSRPESISLVKKTYSTIKIEWPAVESAEKYQIYYSTEKNGTYTKYGTTSKTYCTIKNLNPKTKYYINLRATASIDGKTIKSSYSKKYSITTKAYTLSLAKPKTISLVSKSKDNVSIKWSKVSKADSYEVYYSTSQNGTYTYYTTEWDTSCSIYGLNSGTKYYFKVRAVTNNEYGTFNGKYSSKLAVTTEKEKTQTQIKPQGQTVYVSKNNKYHSKSNCSGMKYYTTMTKSEAVAQGATPCSKCY